MIAAYTKKILPGNAELLISAYFDKSFGTPPCDKCGAAGGEDKDPECERCFCSEICITCKGRRGDDGCYCEDFNGYSCGNPACQPCVDAIRSVNSLYESMEMAMYGGDEGCDDDVNMSMAGYDGF